MGNEADFLKHQRNKGDTSIDMIKNRVLMGVPFLLFIVVAYCNYSLTVLILENGGPIVIIVLDTLRVRVSTHRRLQTV